MDEKPIVDAVTPRLCSLGNLPKNGSLLLNGFTVGKEYRVVGNSGSGVVVSNDNGHERFVMPNESPVNRSAHIVWEWRQRAAGSNYKYPMQTPVGYFEVCKKEG